MFQKQKIVAIIIVIIITNSRDILMTKESNKILLNESLGYLVNRTGMLMKNNFARLLKQIGHEITPEQAAVLLKLNEQDGISQKQLADSLLKDKPNITRILDILEKKELIIRGADSADRRKFKIQLTNKGQEYTEKILPLTLQSKIIYEKILEKEELETFKITLNKLYNTIEVAEFQQ